MIKTWLKNTRNKYIIMAVSIILILSMTGCGNGDIIAKGDNLTVTKEELYDVLVEQHGLEALDMLIGEKITQLEFKKQNIEISEDEIQAELKKMEDFYGGKEAFEDVMAYYGFDLDGMKENISANLKLKKLLRPDINITDEEVVEYFEENKHLMNQEEQVKARHILVNSESLAKEIKEKLSGGEDFIELAKAYSIDEGSKASGGDLGYFGKGEMVESFEKAAFALKEGEISDIVESNHGYHIIKLEDYIEEKEATFEEEKDNIKEILIERSIPETYQKWFQTKYEEYKITNNLDK